MTIALQYVPCEHFGHRIESPTQSQIILVNRKEQYQTPYSTYLILTSIEIDFIDTDNNKNDIRALDSFYLKVLPKLYTTFWLNWRFGALDI
jgi:hypothetical protein